MIRTRAVCVCLAVVGMASSAFAGTTTFGGSVNDTDVRLHGTWKKYISGHGSSAVYEEQGELFTYEADRLVSNSALAHLAAQALDPPKEVWGEGGTTNLTAVCGTRPLSELGTITMLLTQPNRYWHSWGGGSREFQFSSGGEVKFVVQLGPAFPSWNHHEWVGVYFGQQPTALHPEYPGIKVRYFPLGVDGDSKTEGVQNDDPEDPYDHRLGLEGQEFIGLRIAVTDGHLTVSITYDAVNWVPLEDASWPVNNLPGGLGDLSAAPMSLEIKDFGPCMDIHELSWTAATVPDLNGPGLPFPDMDADDDGLNDWYENNTGDFEGPAAAGTDPNNPDTDGDGLLDGFEAWDWEDTTPDGYFNDDPPTAPWFIEPDAPSLDPTKADTDGDGYDDGVELSKGTDPVDPASFPTDDLDNDGLLNEVETGTGVYVDETDTGTDPNNPDTDGDGLGDAVETNTGTYAGPGNTGTNPNVADTDGDGIPDGDEVRLYGTDPTDPLDFPTLPVAGAIGLAALFGAFALVGALLVDRRRMKRAA